MNYSTRSNARRAARAAGLDPDLVKQAADGKFTLPGPAAIEEAHNPAALPTPESVADPLALPEFLRVENRVPLTAEQAARLTEVQQAAGAGDGGKGRQEWAKPKSVSWEEWDARRAAEAEKKRLAPLERIAALKASKGEEPRAGRAPRQPKSEVIAGMVIRLVTKKNPYRDGSAGHWVFALYSDGLAVVDFEKAASGLTGKRKPADMLLYDVRRGHVRLEAAAPAESTAKAPRKGRKA